MNLLMATRWYPTLRYRMRHRATTGTGKMRGTEFADHVRNNFIAYIKHLRGRLDIFENVRVLEIGPGEHLAIPLLFIAAGAGEVVSIDTAREVRTSPEVQHMYQLLLANLPQGLSAARFESALATLPDSEKPGATPIAYYPNMPLEKSTPESLGLFDLIVSTSVLEHVRDLRASFQAMNGLLRPGGWIAHCVDLSSHDRYEEYPLEFLETGAFLWNAQFCNIGGPNRHRIDDYRRFLSETGFSNIYLITDLQFPEEAVDRVRPRLAPGFRHLSSEDLRASVIFLCAQKT